MPLFLEWLTVGAALVILELIIPGTYLIWFGFAALVMSLVTYVVPDFSMLGQLVSLGILSVVFALIGWKMYGKLIFKVNMPEEYKKLNDPIAHLKGKVVTVVDVKRNKYQVTVGDTAWTATSETQFKKGDKAVVIGSDNQVELKIQKILDKKLKKR